MSTDLIVLGKFKETHGAGYPSFHSLVGHPLPCKETIIRYLLKSPVIAAAPGFAVDIQTGQRIPGEYLLYSDSKYCWTSSLPYYVEHYNISLPDDFVKQATANIVR